MKRLPFIARIVGYTLIIVGILGMKAAHDQYQYYSEQLIEISTKATLGNFTD